MSEQQQRPLMQIQHLTKYYDNGGNTNDILQDVNLSVYQDDFLCILGPSGCGKTTMLRCIAGFERYQGDILIEGKRVTRSGPDRIMVFQDFNQLFPWKTVLENVQYPLKVGGLRDKKELAEKADHVLSMVGLSACKDYYPHQLSGGMKQRVAIAKALALSPKIILMDEPFASLDAMTRNNLQRELLRIKSQQRMTVLFVTHNIQEAIILGNRVLLMGRGGAIQEDMQNPIPKPATPATPGFSEVWTHFNDLLQRESLPTGAEEPI